MLRKTTVLIALSIFTASLMLVSCGGGSSSGNSGKAPDVEVVTDDNSGDNTGSDTGNTPEEEDLILVITTENGSLLINGESLSPSSYSSSGAIIIIDENGKSCEYKIDSSAGNITIYPADGAIAGTYNITITAGEREYILVITVSADGKAFIDTAISYPSGSGMVLDIDSGILTADVDGDGEDDSLTLSSLAGSSYIQDSSVISITVKDSSGNYVPVTVDPVTGDIISGSGTGPYTITVVKTDGSTTATYIIKTDSSGKITSIEVEGISHILIPAVNGTAVIVPESTIAGVAISALIPVSEKVSGNWIISDNINSITAFIGVAAIDVTIDPLTGSIITPVLTLAETKVIIEETSSDSKAVHIILLNAEGKVTSYTKVEIKEDGTTTTTIILLDDNGNVKVYEEKIIKPNGETTTTTVVVNSDGTASVTVANTGVMLRVSSGSVSSNGFVLTLTGISGDLWSLKNGVEIVSGMAADGSITIETSEISIDPVTGYLLINGDGTLVPAGPYEIIVLINGSIYIIRSDKNGNILNILPGNILLQTAAGYMTYSDRNVLKIADKAGTNWLLSSQLSSLSASDADGNPVEISIDPYKGNLVTSEVITGPVTVTFVYTDSSHNEITYTVVVTNGSVTSYTAEITNPGPDFDFSTVTNIKIYLNVVDAKTGLPIGQASINLLKANGAAVSDDTWKGFTDSSGVSVFAATVENASKTTEILVSKNGYEAFRCSVDGIGKLIEYARKIALNPVEETAAADSDNDGVADEDDAYPNDPSGAKTITGVYTLAYEDLYPAKGDADFEDLVVRLTIIEKIDSQNKVRQIDLKTKLLASGAGYINQFAVGINGKTYILIPNPKAVSAYTLGYTYVNWKGETKYGSYQNSGTETYHECAEKSHEPIVFAEGITREDLGPMPYDPYIICNSAAANQSHLPSVETSFTDNGGVVKDVDGFTWAVIVPDNWAWPKGGSNNIFKAYPQFDDWYLSSGVNYADWYSNPDSMYIYQK